MPPPNPPSSRADERSGDAQADGARGRSGWVLGLLLFLAVLAAYQRAPGFGFIWDDDAHVTANPCIAGPLGLREIWTTSAARICPLVLTSFWGLHRLFGLDPLPYHVLTLAFHAGSAVLLWLVLRNLRVSGAWLGAALWALHPVQAESAAWVTELKNTQSGFFFLLAVLAYVKGQRAGWSGSRWRYPLTLLWAAMALASKSSTVFLPLVLALCAWWLEGRWRWSFARRLVPFFVLAVAAGLVSLWTQSLEGGSEPLWARGAAERFITAGMVAWFYLGKLAWPHGLAFVYPRWEIDPHAASAYLPTLAALALLAALWLARHTRWRGGWLAYAYFLLALAPVLGVLDHYFMRYSFVGDHFQYLSGIGPLACVGACIAQAPRPLARALGAAAVLVLGALTWRQSATFADEETLWRTSVERSPASWLAHNNLGTALVQAGRLSEAEPCFLRARALNPRHALVHFNLGIVLSRTGRLDEAIGEYQKALDFDPGFADRHNNPQFNDPEAQYCVGRAFQHQHRNEQALVHYLRALELDPDYVDAHYSLGFVLLEQGQGAQAIEHWQRAVELDPNHADAHHSLGTALSEAGRLEEAVAHYREALRIRPDLAQAHYDLGYALQQLGWLDDAVLHYRAALALDPSDVAARTNLAALLASTGGVREAVVEYRAVLERDPRCLAALNNLAWILATSPDASLRDGAAAVALAQRANELGAASNPLVLRTLAAAQAESGDHPGAQQTVRDAIALARSQGEAELVAELESNLRLYEQGRPMRDEGAGGR